MNKRVDYAKASPEGFKAFGDVYVHLQRSGLPKQLVDLVYLRVSQINGCAYCIDMHSRDLLKSGIAVDKLVLVPVWRDAGEIFSARERYALAWTETVTLVAETEVPEADYEAATSAFSDKELADLTYAIGLMNAFNRFGTHFARFPAPSASPEGPLVSKHVPHGHPSMRILPPYKRRPAVVPGDCGWIAAMEWIMLTAAGFLEIGFAFGMKWSAGFTRLLPALFAAAAGLSSVVLLSLALRTLPVGTGYAVWTGIGAAGTAILGLQCWATQLRQRGCSALL